MTRRELIRLAAERISAIMDMDLDMSEIEPMCNRVLNQYDIFIDDHDKFYEDINRMDINAKIIEQIIEEQWVN